MGRRLVMQPGWVYDFPKDINREKYHGIGYGNKRFDSNI